jgi:aryl-alcohol dehydrogenase-like predicted oxidoreductase
MKYVRLGQSGLKISRMCLGCMGFGSPGRGNQAWALGYEDALVIARQAVEAGVNFFDTANVYSDGASEEITGRIVRELMPRDEAIIATKVGLSNAPDPYDARPNRSGLSRKHLLSELDKSLQRLGVDHIDLYIIHRFDPATPIEETMRALDDAVRAGKVRYIGASSMHVYQFVQMQELARREGWERFVSMQNFYNLAWREEDHGMNAYCIETGVALTPWSPLGFGFLARDWRKAERADSERGRLSLASTRSVVNIFGTDADYAVVDALQGVADELGRSMAQVALAWLLQRPGITAPVFGATKPHHVTDAIAAMDVEFEPGQLEMLDGAYAKPRQLGFYQ